MYNKSKTDSKTLFSGAKKKLEMEFMRCYIIVKYITTINICNKSKVFK